MYYIKQINITSEGKNQEDVISSLVLKPGLNIIYGPSNTGKTHIFDCIDFMMGGEAKRLYKKELKIKSVAMVIESDGNELTMRRELKDETKSDIYVAGHIPGIQNGTYTVNAKTKKKDTVSSLWLKLMGINEEVKIISQIEDAIPNTLTIRTFYHMFLINENRISGENSILKSVNGFSNNIPVPTVMSLIYLLTEENYIHPGERKVTPKPLRKVKRTTAQKIVDGSVSAIKEKGLIEKEDGDARTASEIQEQIDQILREISAAENSLRKTTEQDQAVSEKLIEIDRDIAENTVLKERYDNLRSQYESDMRRLTFIAEADIHYGEIPQIERCPFCNGELPKDKTESCLEAAIAEADKISLRIKDLQSANKALEEEIQSLEHKRDKLVHERQRVQASIRGELQPQIETLRDQLVKYTAALERAKAKEMVKYFSEVLNDQLIKINEEDSDLDIRFDVRTKIREVLQRPLNTLLTSILEKCNYENFNGSRFDEDLCDIVVNGSEKMSQGQGFRAFLNSVMAIAVQELMNEYDLHRTNLLVMDSPILSLKERGEDRGTEIASDSMRGGLFQYMIDNTEGHQTIILENQIPALNYSSVNLIPFTRTPGEGRYGLIEGYTE